MHKELRLITALVLCVFTIAIFAEDANNDTAPPVPETEPAPTPTPATVGTTAADTQLAELIHTGEAQLAQGQTDTAIETLTLAVKRAPDSSLAQTRLGGAYLLAQHYNQAIEHFQTAIAVDAGNANAFVGMGVAYMHSARPGAAKAAFTEAKRIAPQKAKEIDEVLARMEQPTSAPAPAASQH